MKYKAIVMGASAGGLDAFSRVLKVLPASFTLPIILVQHLKETDDSYLYKHLQSICQLQVTEALDKQKIQAGGVYVSPPGYHLLIESEEQLSLSADPRVNYSRPSIDLLFESAADVFKQHLIAILMTGANDDGTRGMQAVKQQRGICIVQDPNTATASMMPQSAIEHCAVDFILTLEQIGDWLKLKGKNDER